jgi:hypothetical protein
MNKRIFELAKQADLIQWDTLPSGAKTPDYESVVNAKKFAELIVRECMWKIMQRKEEAIDNDWHVDEAMSAAISDISEHFGVEE